MRGLPVDGSTSSGKSVSTSVISFPRSPHPTKTMTSAPACLARDCSTTVFPVPNPPGMIAAPPAARGNSTSNTRCPVMNGSVGGRRFRNGRGVRTGHLWTIGSAVPSARNATAKGRGTPPPGFAGSFPPLPGGTITRWSTCGVSATTPRTSPGRPRPLPGPRAGTPTVSPVEGWRRLPFR